MSGATIMAIGLTCALGDDWRSAVEGYRTNDRRFVRTGDVVGPDGQPLTLSPVIPYAEERDPIAGLSALVCRASEEATRSAGAPIALELVVPPWAARPPAADALTGAIYDRLAAAIERVSLIASSDDLVPVLLARALDETDEGERLVGAVDTFIDCDVIDALADSNRLLTGSQLHGVVPGEAAAVFRVGSGDPARALGRIEIMVRTLEPRDITRPDGILGRAMAKAVRNALGEGGEAHGVDRLLIDLDGERWRAEEAGFALASSTVGEDLTGDFETPLSQTGACGAASPGVVLALALAPSPVARMSEDGTDPTRALVLTSGRDGQRCASIVRRFERENKIGEDAR